MISLRQFVYLSIILLNACAPSLPEASSPIAPPPLNRQSKIAPFRAVVALDKSGSVREHHMPLPTLDEVQPLLDLVKTYGGELAFASICDDSLQPLLRLKIDEPPVLNPKYVASTFTDSDSQSTTNELFVSDQLAQFQEEEAKKKPHQQAHREALQAHEIKTQKALDIFFPKLKQLLQKPATCQETDINGLTQRLTLFLNEDATRWSQPPQRYALMVTDGLDTVNRTTVAFPKETTLLLVNGSGSKGVFAKVPHQHFEATSAAIEHMTNAIRTGGQKS